MCNVNLHLKGVSAGPHKCQAHQSLPPLIYQCLAPLLPAHHTGPLRRLGAHKSLQPEHIQM